VLRRFLGPADQELLSGVRRVVLDMHGPLARLDAIAGDIALLDEMILQLDDLFSLVIVGEFNAGKSAFVNALLGTRLLEEGVTPTTTQIQIIRWGEQPGPAALRGDTRTFTHPSGWLRDICLIDTPGTNAVIQRHQVITEEFIPRADLVLFITSADRPFSESERLFLGRIREWGKKVVIVVNKIDILENAVDIERVLSYVDARAYELLGQHPVCFAISARLARQASEAPEGAAATALREKSRLEPLEAYISATLDERQRFRLKLLSPLGVAQRLAGRYLNAAAERKAVLEIDVGIVRDVEADLVQHEADMHRDFSYRLSRVENVLYALQERGNRFFDETIRLTRVRDLISPDRIRAQFEQQVVSDTVAQLDVQTQELIDWMVAEDLRQWQTVTERLNRRVAQAPDQARRPQDSPDLPWFRPGFEHNRQELLKSVGQAARQIVDTYDQRTEAKALADSLQRAVAQTALFEVGAVGLGALLVKLLAVTMADFTGLLAAGAVAVAGLYIIPLSRRRAKRSLASKVGELRQRLRQALSDQFEVELARSTTRVRDAVRPYSRFAEQQLVETADAESALLDAQARMRDLVSVIERHVR
jgi:small GTP-binding protein